jgi:hypothetical protein
MISLKSLMKRLQKTGDEKPKPGSSPREWYCNHNFEETVEGRWLTHTCTRCGETMSKEIPIVRVIAYE